MRSLRVAHVILLAGLAASCQTPADRAARAAAGREDVLLALNVDIIEATVPRHATLGGLLQRHDLSAAFAESMVGAVRSVFDPRRLREDQPYRLTRSLDGLFHEFRYTLDADRFLRVVLRAGSTDASPAFDVEVVPYPKEILVESVAVEITRARPSLSAALDDAGENIQLALLLADAFSGDVDFNSDLQPGDRFEVLFGRVLRNGEFSGYDDVKVAVLHNEKRTLTAVRHTAPDGRAGWYDQEGRSLKRQFLKSPLSFDPRVTSRFSYRRLHPVLGTYRAHRGVDYGAAYGSAVVAVASGTVTSVGWAGDAGRRVTIRHASGYESGYLHLSAFASGIRPGARVSQGDSVGRVGNSGTVTGTHLHYELKRNGTHVNPVTEHRNMPPGVPIPADALPAFLAERDRLLSTLRTSLPPTADSPPAIRPH